MAIARATVNGLAARGLVLHFVGRFIGFSLAGVRAAFTNR
jgi:hypothetical protein